MCQKRPGRPSYWRLLFQGDRRASLRDAILSTGKRLEKAQERYKRDFVETVASMNRNMKAGDQAFLDVRGTLAEQHLLGRRRTKLDWKTVAPNTVLANYISTIALNVDGLPERINSDRIRPAPSEMDTLLSEGQGVTPPSLQDTESPVERVRPDGDGTLPERRRSPPPCGTRGNRGAGPL